MRESMTLIEQANIFHRTMHRNLFFDRIATNKTVDVYASRPFLPTTNQPSKSSRTEKVLLPSIERKRSKRPSYRTSLYHPNASLAKQIDHSLLTARGKKPESACLIRDEGTFVNFQRNHAPPPSPSDDQIVRILSELNRTRRSSPYSPSPAELDGNIPYRLPALDRSARRKQTSKDTTSTLSSYLQTYE